MIRCYMSWPYATRLRTVKYLLKRIDVTEDHPKCLDKNLPSYTSCMKKQNY